jgi:predicted nucleic acid-binding protein
MIFIDSSFAIEWLIGTQKAKKISLAGDPRAILPAQYAEILCYFFRNFNDYSTVAEELEILVLEHPTREELQQASILYCQSRSKKKKASLADAILAAVASYRNEPLLSFDKDFSELGLIEKSPGVWEGESLKI